MMSIDFARSVLNSPDLRRNLLRRLEFATDDRFRHQRRLKSAYESYEPASFVRDVFLPLRVLWSWVDGQFFGLRMVIRDNH
jgi:hypothetical protein